MVFDDDEGDVSQLSYQALAKNIASKNKVVPWARESFKSGVTFRVGTIVDTEITGDTCFALVLIHDRMTGPVKCVVPNRYGMHWKEGDFIPSATLSMRKQSGDRPSEMYPDKHPSADPITFNDKLSPSGPSTDPSPDARAGKIDQMKESGDADRWDGDVVIVGICDGQDPFVVSWVRHKFTDSFHTPSSLERAKGVPIYFDYNTDKADAAKGAISHRDRLTRGRDPSDHPRWRDTAGVVGKVAAVIPSAGFNSATDSFNWHNSHGEPMPAAPSTGSYDRIPCPIPTINFSNTADGSFVGGKQSGYSCLPWLVEISALEVAGTTFHAGSAAGMEAVPFYDDPRRFLPAMVKSSLEGVKTSQWGPYLSTWFDPFMHSVGSPNAIGQYLHKELVDKSYTNDSSLEWATKLDATAVADPGSALGSKKIIADEGVRRLMYGGTGEIRLPKIITDSDDSPETIGRLKFYSNETLSKWEFRSDKAGVYSSEIDIIAGRQAASMSFFHPKSASGRKGSTAPTSSEFDTKKSFCPWVVGGGDLINNSVGDTEDAADEIRSGIRPGGFTWSYRLRLKQPNPSVENDRGVGKLLVAGDNQFEIRAGTDPAYNRDGLQRWGTYDESRSIFAKKGISLIAPGEKEGGVDPQDGYKRGGLYVTGPTDEEKIEAPVETADYVDSHKEWDTAQTIFVEAIVKYPQLRDVLTTMMNLLTDLKEKHNDLVDTFNSHQHSYTTSAGVQVPTADSVAGLPVKGSGSKAEKDNTTADSIKLIKSKTVFCGSE